MNQLRKILLGAINCVKCLFCSFYKERFNVCVAVLARLFGGVLTINGGAILNVVVLSHAID